MSEFADTIGLLSLETCGSILLLVIAVKLYKMRSDTVLESDCCSKCLKFKSETHNPGADELPNLGNWNTGSTRQTAQEEQKLSSV
jgi:hypothetical protein